MSRPAAQRDLSTPEGQLRLQCHNYLRDLHYDKLALFATVDRMEAAEDRLYELLQRVLNSHPDTSTITSVPANWRLFREDR